MVSFQVKDFQMVSGIKSRFEVRLARNEYEIAEAQRLRYSVFVEEFGASVSKENRGSKIDVDKFDKFCEHLLLVDKSYTRKQDLVGIVGTIRLLEADVARKNLGFYSANEYDVSMLYASEKKSLEIGRSCIHRSYRKNVALHLLWKGLSDVVISREIKILFGVASFPGSNPDCYRSALSLLYHKHRAPKELNFKVLPKGSLDMNIIPNHEIDEGQAMIEMPSLIKAYLRLGGKVADGAFMDRSFNTIDVGIIIDTDKMTSRYREFYERGRSR